MAKFSFNYSTAEVKERPVNELDKKPGDYDIISLEDEILSVMSKVKFDSNNLNLNKPQHVSEMPDFMKLKVRLLKVARAIQRPYMMNHALNISYGWDSRRPLFPVVVYNPLTDEYWIIEGNHTSIAQGYRAATGSFPDFNSEEWLNFEIKCQVVTLNPDKNGNVDMSFCRDHFTGTNGDDREPLDEFDFYKNYVLKVRQDYAGDLQKCDDDNAKKYYNLQVTAESWDLTPVHPRSGRNTMLPGAITHIKAFTKLKIDDINFIGKNHKEFWDNEVVDAIELDPLATLRKLIDKNKSDPDEFHSKQHKKFMYEMAAVMQKFGTTPSGFKDFAVDVWKEYYQRTALLVEKKIPAPPKDFSLILWLRLHKKVGGKYNCIPNSVYTRFIENDVDVIECLPKAKKKFFKDFA
jgi:hypothetical protein